MNYNSHLDMIVKRQRERTSQHQLKEIAMKELHTTYNTALLRKRTHTYELDELRSTRYQVVNNFKSVMVELMARSNKNREAIFTELFNHYRMRQLYRAYKNIVISELKIHMREIQVTKRERALFLKSIVWAHKERSLDRLARDLLLQELGYFNNSNHT